MYLMDLEDGKTFMINNSDEVYLKQSDGMDGVVASNNKGDIILFNRYKIIEIYEISIELKVS